MKKFWEWMAETEYCKIRETEVGLRYRFIGHGKYISNISIQPQMLIGYMIEYLFLLGYDTEILQMKEYDIHNIEDYHNYLIRIVGE